MRQSKVILQKRPSAKGYRLIISPQALAEVKAEFDQYCAQVLDSALRPTSQDNYIDFAANFLRWLEGQFQPGAFKAFEPKPSRSTRRDPTE